MMFEEVLEEHGLTNDEWLALKMVCERSALFVSDHAQMLNMKKSNCRTIMMNLNRLGLASSKAGKGNEFQTIPTAKGKEVKQLLSSAAHKANIEAKQVTEEEPKSGPELTEKQGQVLGSVIEIGKFMDVLRQLSNLNAEWLQILGVLRGCNRPMTAEEISFELGADSLSLEIITDRIERRSCPTKKKRWTPDQRWLDRVSDEPVTVTLSEVGTEAIRLAMEDLELRCDT